MIPHLRLHSDLLFRFFFFFWRVRVCVYTSPLLWRPVNIVRVSFTSAHGSSGAHGNVLCKNMRCAYCHVLWRHNKWREKLTASSGKYISASWICLCAWAPCWQSAREEIPRTVLKSVLSTSFNSYSVYAVRSLVHLHFQPRETHILN